MNTLKRWFPFVIGSGLIVLLVVSFLAMAPTFAQGPGGMMNQGMGGKGMQDGFGPGGMMEGMMNGMMGGGMGKL